MKGELRMAPEALIKCRAPVNPPEAVNEEQVTGKKREKTADAADIFRCPRFGG